MVMDELELVEFLHSQGYDIEYVSRFKSYNRNRLKGLANHKGYKWDNIKLVWTL